MRRLPGLIAALALAGALLAPSAAHAVTFVLVNADSAGEGFNDPTPAAPVGGNPGTTLGQQRQNVFLRAAQIWGAILPGTVPIVVRAQFNPLSCTANSATLGSAGPLSVYRDYPGVEFAGTWYTEGQANQVLGFDADPATPEISANFNRRLGEVGCLTGIGWYLGLDHNPGTQINLLSTILHEFAHGLGFLELVNEPTGALFNGLPDIYTRFIRDTQINKTWNVMTNAERIASATRDGLLVWDGKAVNTRAATYLQQEQVLQVLSPAGIAGEYRAGIASFGGEVTRDGTTGAVVLANDGTALTSDACTPLTNAAAIAGNIALVDRGNCTFTTKAANAQAAGAIGVLIANNASGNTPLSPSGTDPSISIPVLGLTLNTGATLKGQLGTGVTATLQMLGPDRLAGANPSRKVYLYAPLAYAAGSSISHFDVSASPGLLMEPFDTGLGSDDPDLTTYAFEDMGWFNPRTTSVEGGMPAALWLTSSPNPFRQSTTVNFALPRAGLTEVAVFDLSGREVAKLANHWMPAGPQRLTWGGADRDGRRLPAGVYLYRVRLGGDSWSERVVLLD